MKTKRKFDRFIGLIKPEQGKRVVLSRSIPLQKQIADALKGTITVMTVDLKVPIFEVKISIKSESKKINQANRNKWQEILIYGAGTIGMTYGWLLSQGHEVEVLVKERDLSHYQKGVSL